MSKQMRSILDFERICKNCWHYQLPSDDDHRCIHPEIMGMCVGNFYPEEDFNCKFWETRYNEPHYLVAEYGKILEEIEEDVG